MYCCEARYDPDFVETGRILKEYELLFVREGSITATFNEKVFTVEERQLIIMSPGCFFSLRNNNCEAEVVICSFSCSAESEKFGDAFVIELDKFQANYIDNLIVLAGDKDEISRQILRLTIELQFLRLKGGEFRHNWEPCSYDSAGKYSSVYNYLKENVAKRLSLKRIAADNKTGVSSLKSIVMRYTGGGVIHLFNMIKILNVIESVKKGEDLKTATRNAGFSDIRYFRRLLKKETGFNSVEAYFGE